MGNVSYNSYNSYIILFIVSQQVQPSGLSHNRPHGKTSGSFVQLHLWRGLHMEACGLPLAPSSMPSRGTCSTRLQHCFRSHLWQRVDSERCCPVRCGFDCPPIKANMSVTRSQVAKAEGGLWQERGNEERRLCSLAYWTFVAPGFWGVLQRSLCKNDET